MDIGAWQGLQSTGSQRDTTQCLNTFTFLHSFTYICLFTHTHIYILFHDGLSQEFGSCFFFFFGSCLFIQTGTEINPPVVSGCGNTLLRTVPLPLTLMEKKLAHLSPKSACLARVIPEGS